MRRISLAFVLALLVPVSLLFLLPASSACAQLIAPSFVRQWTAGAAAYWDAIATDPSGNVFVFIGPAGSGGHVTKYTHDGTTVAGQWSNPVTATGGMASDPAGRIYLVTYGPKLLEFTNTGVSLGSFSPPHFGGYGPIAFDAAGNLYANGTNASGQRTVNEYHLNGANFALIHSALYPGSPNTGFAPSGFLGLATDGDGSVYGSATTTTNNSLLKYPPSLDGAPGFLQDCASGGPTFSCFGGFGIAFTHANVLGGTAEELVVFAAGGFGGGSSSNFYRMGIFLTNAGPAGTSRYIGSYDQQPVPGNYTTAVGSVAASRCHAAVYELVSVFGGPGTTLSNFEVQEFDTHAAPTSCPTTFTAKISDLGKKYVLAHPKGGTIPCVPCASLLKSGAAVSSANVEAVAAKKKRKKKAGGVAIIYQSSAAADTSFQFKRVSGRGPKKKLGGFLYAAQEGKNAPVFSGVLRKKHRLSPGTYQVTVSAGQNEKRFKLIVQS